MRRAGECGVWSCSIFQYRLRNNDMRRLSFGIFCWIWGMQWCNSRCMPGIRRLRRGTGLLLKLLRKTYLQRGRLGYCMFPINSGQRPYVFPICKKRKSETTLTCCCFFERGMVRHRRKMAALDRLSSLSRAANANSQQLRFRRLWGASLLRGMNGQVREFCMKARKARRVFGSRSPVMILSRRENANSQQSTS